MTSAADIIVGKIRALERELETEFARQRAGLGFGPERGQVAFEAEIVRRHREMKTSLWSYLINARPLVILTSPVIYALALPFVLVDLSVSGFQAICFRVYDIPQVNRGRYLIFDRSGLAYLNALEKLNCAYCSYVNGVIAYAREIASRTEQYWCPIKYARRVYGAHPRYSGFEEYGDGERYHRRRETRRADLRAERDEDNAPPTPAPARADPPR
jgi:hypothetical protein